MKTVAAPKLQDDVPIPEHRLLSSEAEVLRGTLKKMRAGQSFIWPTNKPLFDAARLTGVPIRTLKINGQGYRCWKLRKGMRTNKQWKNQIKIVYGKQNEMKTSQTDII